MTQTLNHAVDVRSLVRPTSGTSPETALRQDPLTGTLVSVLNPRPLSLDTATALIDDYLQRLTELVPREDVAQWVITETCHSGLVTAEFTGYSGPTHHTRVVAEQARRWRQRASGDLLIDIMTAELLDGDRMLLNNAHWIAFAPYASAHHREIMIVPKAPARTLVATTDEEREDLATTYRQLMGALLRAFGPQLSYHATWTMAPIPHCREISRLWCSMTVQDAPVDSTADVTTPERTAAWLRRLL